MCAHYLCCDSLLSPHLGAWLRWPHLELLEVSVPPQPALLSRSLPPAHHFFEHLGHAWQVCFRSDGQAPLVHGPQIAFSPSCTYVKDGPAVALSSSASCVEKAAATLSLPFLAPDLKDALGQSGGGGMDLGGPGPD